MTLDRTIIIPSDDSQLAQKLFRALVYDEDVLVVVVLGDDDTSAQAVKCADRRAKVVIGGFERKVAWIRDRAILADEIKQLQAGTVDSSKEDLTKVVAFSISLKNTVMDVVRMGDDINFLQMEMAFLEAGKA